MINTREYEYIYIYIELSNKQYWQHVTNMDAQINMEYMNNYF